MKNIWNHLSIRGPQLFNLKRTLGSFLGCVLCIGLTGCEAPVDYYSLLAPSCNYLSARTDNAENTLIGHEDCKQALLDNLPWSNTIRDLPDASLSKILEAVQVLVAYPIALPQHASDVQIYSFAGNHFSAKIYCIPFGDLYPNLCEGLSGGLSSRNEIQALNSNQAMINYIFSRVKEINFLEGDDTAYASAALGKITLYSSYLEAERTAFMNAGVLLHERAHLDSQPHIPCKYYDDNCDTDINGPYGLQLFYAQNLLDLNASAKLPTGELILSNDDIYKLSKYICHSLERVNLILESLDASLEPTLGTLSESFDCNLAETRSWISENAPQWIR